MKSRLTNILTIIFLWAICLPLLSLTYRSEGNHSSDTDVKPQKDTIHVIGHSGMGQPVVAFNFQPTTRKTIVEAMVYSRTEPFSVKANYWSNFYGSKNIPPINKGQGNVETVMVRDGSGKNYPAQIVWIKETPPGFTSKVMFIVDHFPAGGYKTFYVDMSKPGEYNEVIPFKDNTFETDFFRIKFDMKTGGISVTRWHTVSTKAEPGRTSA